MAHAVALASVLLAMAGSAHAVPTVSIGWVGSPEALIEGRTAQFKVTSDEAAPSGGLAVRLEITETTAQRPLDVPPESEYPTPLFLAPGERGARTVRIAAGTTSQTFSVAAKPADGIHEWVKQNGVKIDVLNDIGYNLGTANALSFGVQDDSRERSRIRLVESSSAVEVSERGEFVELTVQLHDAETGRQRPAAYPIGRSFTVAGSTTTAAATEGVDYRVVGAKRVEFAAHTTETKLRIEVIDDTRVEGTPYTLLDRSGGLAWAEGLRINFETSDSEVVLNDQTGAEGEIFILDDDTAPIVARGEHVTEGETIRVEVGVDDPVRNGCEVTFPITADVVAESHTLDPLGEGQTSTTAGPLGPILPEKKSVRLSNCADTAVVTFHTLNNERRDATPWRGATFRLANVQSGSAGSAQRVHIGRHVHAVHIYDDDDPAPNLVAVDDYARVRGGEDSVDIDVVGNDSIGSADPATVDVAWTGNPANGTVEILDSPPGTVRYTPESGFSGRDGFRYRIEGGASESSARVEVTVDGGTQPVWTATWTGGTTLAEGGTALSVTVANSNTNATRTAPHYVNVTVSGTDEGAEPADLQIRQGGVTLSDANLAGPSGATTGRFIATHGGAIRIAAHSDGTTEGAERLDIALFAEGRPVANGRRAVLITGQETQTRPAATFASSSRSVTVNEGDTATLAIALDAPAPQDLLVRVDAAVTEQSSAYPRYAPGHLGPRTVHIAEGASTGTVALRVIDDDVVSRNPQVTFTIGAGTGYTVGTEATAQVRVLDGAYKATVDESDPQNPVMSYAFDAEGDVAVIRWKECGKAKRVAEDAGEVELAIELDGEISYEWPVVLIDMEGSAGVTDFDRESVPGSLSTGPGANRNTFTVRIIKREQIEETEGFAVSLFRHGQTERNIQIDSECNRKLVEITDDDTGNVRAIDLPEQVEEGSSIAVKIEVEGATNTNCIVPFPIALKVTPVEGTAVLTNGATAQELRFPPCTLHKTATFATTAAAGAQGTRTVVFEVTWISSDRRVSLEGQAPPQSARYSVDVTDDPNRSSGGPTVRFEGAPERHDGTSAFKVSLRMSGTPDGLEPKRDAPRVITASGGQITKARATASGANPVWELTVRPGGAGPVTLTVPARECSAANALCIGGAPLGRTVTVNVAGPATRSNEPPTVSIEGPAASPVDEGETLSFTLRRTGTGAEALAVEVSVSETGSVLAQSNAQSATFAAGQTSATLEVATLDDDTEEGASTVTVRVATGTGYTVDAQGASASGVVESDDLAPITAAWTTRATEHDGASPFEMAFAFSHEPKPYSFRTVHGHLFDVSGGTIEKVSRLTRGSNIGWRLRVRPAGNGAVSLDARATTDCAAQYAACDADGRKFDGALEATVLGLAELSVADAMVEEEEGATLDFVVTLSRARTERTTVDYATSDGTARAGDDYTAASGTLTFEPGATAKTVQVTVHDDSHDEDAETMTLTLANARGAVIADATATGTIENTDPMPKAWMVRFGRTVGGHVVDALAARLDGGDRSHVTVAGIEIGRALDGSPSAESADDPFALPEWARAQREANPQTLTGRDMVLRSAFHLSSRDEAGSSAAALTAWGHVTTGGFEAEEDGVAIDGDVTTGLVGFDAEWDHLLAGVMLSMSEGDGAYRLDAGLGDDAGTVEASMTGVYPYARVDLDGQISTWALAGVGSGRLTLKQEGARAMPTDLSMRMGAVGVRGQILEAHESGGIGLAIKSDAMWVSTKSDDTDELARAEGDATRVRLTLEGERRIEAEGGAELVPSLEIGVRHDGGDAETGTGVELGAGVRYAAGALSIEGRVRTLIAHEASGYEEWGASGAIRVHPGGSGRGLTLAITPEWGRTGSATQRLWSARDASALGTESDLEPTGRLAIDAGYGLGLGAGHGVLTPYGGMTLGEGSAHTVRAGARWQLGPDIAAGLEARRSGSEDAESANEVRLHAAVRF